MRPGLVSRGLAPRPRPRAGDPQPERVDHLDVLPTERSSVATFRLRPQSLLDLKRGAGERAGLSIFPAHEELEQAAESGAEIVHSTISSGNPKREKSVGMVKRVISAMRPPSIRSTEIAEARKERSPSARL